MENILINLWEIVESLIKNINRVWEWLNEPFTIGFKLFGFEISLGTFVPLNLIGGGILVLLGFWLIKALLPGA
ncbi:MAG TPA: hypothetical protein VIK77_12455 [Tissierellaceae bacterium]